MKIGDRMKERRVALGLTVEEVAEQLGKNRATIYRYENNEIENVPTTILEPLSKALRTTPAALMGWEEDPSAHAISQLQGVYLSYAKEAQENGISPEDIKLAIDTIKRLRGE